MDFHKIIDLCSILVEMVLLINVWKKGSNEINPQQLFSNFSIYENILVHFRSLGDEAASHSSETSVSENLSSIFPKPTPKMVLRWSQVWDQWSKWVTCVEWRALVLAGSLSGMQSAGALPTRTSSESDLDRASQTSMYLPRTLEFLKCRFEFSCLAREPEMLYSQRTSMVLVQD